ncbi:MAG TPA: FAD-dependent oxidoreductase [Gammaproteobacteria bacterium]
MDFDIIVIGGGIQGAGVLQAAAAAGYSALLLEQQAEPAAGTSSRSSKLIHGGLRYLESGEIGLVYECLRERKLLLQNAPQLVKLQPFYIPVYQESKRRPWTIQAGLILYTLLAGLEKKTIFRVIKRNRREELNGLKQAGLLKVFRYADAQTDDAALTRAVLHSAQTLGAEVRLNAKFLNADRSEQGYAVNYLNRQTGATHRLSAHALVNAAGPWINRVMDGIQPAPAPFGIDLVQGSHILLPGSIGERIYYLEAPRDKRAIFVMPWKGNLMVGTTEHVFEGDPADTAATPEEIAYLLGVFNHYFPQFYAHGPATERDLLGSFAGLRVLPKDTSNPFVRTRETQYVYDDKHRPRLVAIYGGKLTSYRSTAEKVVKKLAPQLPPRIPRADTKKLRLT